MERTVQRLALQNLCTKPAEIRQPQNLHRPQLPQHPRCRRTAQSIATRHPHQIKLPRPKLAQHRRGKQALCRARRVDSNRAP